MSARLACFAHTCHFSDMHSRPLSRLFAGLTVPLAILPATVTGQELAEKEFPKANPARPGSPPNPALAPPRVPYPVVRYSLNTLRFDTIVQLMPDQSPRPPLSPVSSNAGTLVVYIGTTPVQSVDVWAAYPDGTVAVVRAAPYRIEWFSPDKSRSSTEPVPHNPISVTSGDRKRVVEEFKRTADAALQSNPIRTAIPAINYDEPASWPASQDVVHRFIDSNDVLPRHTLAGLP